MLLLPYLYDRQIGSLRKTQPNFTRPDLDCLLSRLVCDVNDVFITRGEDGIPVPPYTCKFRKDKESDLLAVANEDGEVYLIDTDKGKGVVKNFTAHNNAIFDVCWVPDKNGLVTGSGDFRCCLFDMHTCKKVSTFRHHTASIKAVDVFQDGSGTTLAAGSKDGNISIWDVREDGLNTQPAIVINQAHERVVYNSNKKAVSTAHTSSSVSAVTFRDGHTLTSAGVGDSVIKIWDLRKIYVNTNTSYRRKPRESITFTDNKIQGFGYTSLVYNSLYTKLYACSTANKIFEIDCHSFTKKYERFTGLKSSTYFVKMSVSHDDQYIASGSSDNKAYIWKTSKPGLPIFELAGHTAEVTSVAWGAYNNTKIATCGDDHKVLLWRTKYSDHLPENPDIEKVAASCPYSSGISTDSSDTISIFLPVTPMTHAKKSANSKSPPTSNSIRSYFSPLPPTPTSRMSNQRRESTTLQSSQSSRKSIEPLSSDGNQDELTASLSLCNQNRKSVEKELIQTVGSQKSDNFQSAQSQSTPESGSPITSSDSPSKENAFSASMSLPEQSSCDTESTKSQTICSSESEKLSNSVSVKKSRNGSGDTTKEYTEQQSLLSRNTKSTSNPQSSHVPKSESSLIFNHQLNYKPSCESTLVSDQQSGHSVNVETTQPMSGHSPNKEFTPVPSLLSGNSLNSETKTTSQSINDSNREFTVHQPSQIVDNADKASILLSPPQSSIIPICESSQRENHFSNEPTTIIQSTLSPNHNAIHQQSINSPISDSTQFKTYHSPNGESSLIQCSASSLNGESSSIQCSASSLNGESSSIQCSASSLNRNSNKPCNSLSNSNSDSTNSPSSNPTRNTSGPQVVHREPLSPVKNAQGPSMTKVSGVGKENGKSVCKKMNGQTKRKLDVSDRACKHHLEGCGKTRGKTRCGKRIVVTEKNSLTDYFSIIQTPDKYQTSTM